MAKAVGLFAKPRGSSWTGSRRDLSSSSRAVLRTIPRLSPMIVTRAGSNYFYARGDLTTLFTLPKQFSLKLRVAGQGALEPIISNENYSIAGSDGVRGYLESEELGDSAIRGTVQFQSPAVHWHDRQLGDAYVFFDGGRTQVIDPLEGQRGHTTLRSLGSRIRFFAGPEGHRVTDVGQGIGRLEVPRMQATRVHCS